MRQIGSRGCPLTLATTTRPNWRGGLKKTVFAYFDANDLSASLAGVSGNISVSQFSKGLQITIKNDPAQIDGVNLDSLSLYFLDPNTKQWVPVTTSQYDKTQNTLTAIITHFSNYGEIGDALVSGPGRVLAADVDPHSGAATYTYPIELPPGPGGFQPKLNLVYDSASVDEMKNKQATGSWVGTGWRLSPGSITYDWQTTLYYLDLNGMSYQLASSDGVNFKTNPDQFYKITFSNNTWSLYDKDGNYYQFGGDTGHTSQQYKTHDRSPGLLQMGPEPHSGHEWESGDHCLPAGH